MYSRQLGLDYVEGKMKIQNQVFKYQLKFTTGQLILQYAENNV